MRASRSMILELLAIHRGGLSKAQLAKATGQNKPAIKMMLWKIHQSGLVQKTGRGRNVLWTLAKEEEPKRFACSGPNSVFAYHQWLR